MGTCGSDCESLRLRQCSKGRGSNSEHTLLITDSSSPPLSERSEVLHWKCKDFLVDRELTTADTADSGKGLITTSALGKLAAISFVLLLGDVAWQLKAVPPRESLLALVPFLCDWVTVSFCFRISDGFGLPPLLAWGLKSRTDCCLAWDLDEDAWGWDWAIKVHSAQDVTSDRDLWCAWRGHANSGTSLNSWEDGISKVSSSLLVPPGEERCPFFCEAREGVLTAVWDLSCPTLLLSVLPSANAGLSLALEDSETNPTITFNYIIYVSLQDTTYKCSLPVLLISKILLMHHHKM